MIHDLKNHPQVIFIFIVIIKKSMVINKNYV